MEQVSVFQFPTMCNDKAPININSTTKKLIKLSDSCTVIPAVALKKGSVTVPFPSISSQLSSFPHINEALQTG